MRRIIIFTLLALTAFGGVASADRSRNRDHRSGGIHVQDSRYRHDRSRYERPRHDRPRYDNRQRYQQRPRVVVRPNYRQNYRHVVRKPIYVQRPVIKYRYYNYYQRPAIIVENHPPMDGYYWVPGQWSWNGYEWIWMPGHYEPDPSYQYPYSYDSGYYNY